MVFRVGQIWLKPTLVAMVTKICDFQHKIGYNLACDTAQMLARNRGFSGSANLIVSDKLWSDDPCCHGNENLRNFNKIAITRLEEEICP